jgi:hypothetical protein
MSMLISTSHRNAGKRQRMPMQSWIICWLRLLSKEQTQLWQVYEFGFCEQSLRRGRAAFVAHNFLNTFGGV